MSNGDAMKIHGNKAVAEYVHQWGNSASLALLDPACKIFSCSEIQGLIGYRFALKSAIVFGDPVCASPDIKKLTQAFHAFCAERGKSIVYISVSQDFIGKSLDNGCRAAIGFGDEIILDPQLNLRAGTGRKASVLRNKCNQSMRDGVTIHEYTGYDHGIEEGIEQVGAAWINGRKGAQIYLWQINLFADRLHKRWFYAQCRGRIIGVLMLNRLAIRDGWALNILMVEPQAPNTTSEYLVLSTLDILRDEKCRYLTIGTTPASELGYIHGVGKYSTWFARNVYSLAKKIFNLGDRQRYWKKFHPKTEPLYLAFSNARISMSDILAVMRALNVGSRPQKKQRSMAVKS